MKTPFFQSLLAVACLLCSFSSPAANWVSRHNLTPTQYQAAFDDFYNQGYRLKSLSGYTKNGQELYEALWVKNNGTTWAASHAMTAQGYQDLFDYYFKKGYRLTVISCFALGNQSRFAAVWEKKGGPKWAAKHNMTEAEYQKAITDMKADGYRPLQVCGYVVAGKEYFAAIWDKSSGAWAARHNLTETQYQEAFTTFSEAGYVLKNVSGYNKGGQDLYAAIWEKRSTPLWAARHGIPDMNYQHASDNMYYQGYVPTYLNAFASSGSCRYNTIWENTSMKGSDIGHIDKAMTDYMTGQSVEGLSLAISKNGKLVFAKSYGLANKSTGEELSPSHSLRIMSVSKPITTLGIMKLREEYSNILSRRVFGPNSILGDKYPTPAGKSKLNNITVRQMLWHTSGLRSCNGEDVFWDASKTVNNAMNVLLGASDLITTDTGMQWIYSNTNYFFIGRVIEQLSGKSYETYIRGKVLEPCGIGNTMFVGRADGKPGAGEVTYDPGFKQNMQLWGPFGGWVARPMDLLKFLIKVDGATPPTDIITGAAHTVMTTGSSIATDYALGWGVSGNVQNHNGCNGSSRSYLVEMSGGLCYSIIINTAPTNDNCGGKMRNAIEAALAKVSGYPSYNLF